MGTNSVLSMRGKGLARLQLPVSLSVLIVACILGDATQAEDEDFSFLEDIIEQRQQIQHGSLEVVVKHEIAKITLQSYEGVTLDINTEFLGNQDFWRQEVELIHPRWNRRTVTLFNSDGTFHDKGGNTLYATFTSPGESDENQPRAYDFRFLGLVFPLSQLSPHGDWQPTASWAQGLKVNQVEQVQDPGGHLLKRYSCSAEDGVDVTIVIDTTANNVPVTVRRSLEDAMTEANISYSLIEVLLKTGKRRSLWFPREIVYEIHANGDVGSHFPHFSDSISPNFEFQWARSIRCSGWQGCEAALGFAVGEA